MAADKDVKMRLLLEVPSGQAVSGVKDIGRAGADAAKNVKGIGDAAKVAGHEARQATTQFDKLKQSTGMGSRPGEARTTTTYRDSGSGRAYGAGTPEGKALAKEYAKERALGDAGSGKGGGESAELAKLAATATAALGAIKTFATAVTAAARTVDLMGDSSLATHQKLRKIYEELPVLGEGFKAVGSLADALSGKTKTIREAGIADAKHTATTQANAQAFQAGFPLQQQSNAIVARAKAVSGAESLKFAPPARDGSAQGDVAYSEYERRFALAGDTRNAGIDLATAKSGSVDAAKQRQDIENELAQAVKVREDRERAFKEAEAKAAQDKGSFKGKATSFASQASQAFGVFYQGSGADADKFKSSSDLKGALTTELDLRQKLVTAKQNEANAGKDAAQAESAFRKANIAEQKQELEFLKEKEQRIRGSSGAYGSLSAVDKQAALESAQQLKSGGYNTLTPEQKQALSGAGFGNVLQNEAIKSAQADPGYAKIAQLLGQDSDLKAAQAKQIDIQSKVQVAVEFDQAELSKQMLTGVKEALGDVVKQLKEIANIQIQHFNVGMAQAQAGQ